MTSVLQRWVTKLPLMQQSVLLTAIRGPDGVEKYGPTKMLLRWYRRCILISAFDKKVLTDPYDPRGGSFTGPSLSLPDGETYRKSSFHITAWAPHMHLLVGEYLRGVDAIPHHFHMHLVHGCEILGYKHPDKQIRDFWDGAYDRFARSLHMYPETEDGLDERLGDRREGWLKHADEATTE